MATKMPRWATVRESIKEDNSRRAQARKFKERYKNACLKEKIMPLNSVMKEFENTRMNLKGRMLAPKDAKVLAAILIKIGYLYKIDLSSNCLGDEGAGWIAEIIPRTMSITNLNLSENSIGPTGLRALVSALSENLLITTFVISGNEIGDEGAKLLAELLETRTGILKLRASHAGIAERGATAIGMSLADNDVLETLDLSWNHIRGKGAISIANSLKKNKCLKRLNVSWNGFAMDGARAMGEALAENSRLEELDLTNNRIDRNCMAPLMIGLKTNSTLQTLKLGKNSFDNEVAKYLLTIIEANEKSALINVEFSDIPVDESFMEIHDRVTGARNIHIGHGRLVRKIVEKKYEPPPVPPRDPLELMFEFKYEHGYRTLDLLNRMDRDNNMSISRDELKLGMMEMDVVVDDEQVDDVISRLDTNNDGEIDYSELVQGEKEWGSRHKRHMNMQTIQKIRSLAQAMLRMKISAKLDEVANTKIDKTDKSTDVEGCKEEAKKHKTKHK